MEFIDTALQLDRALRAERAIVALHVQWSMPAREAVSVVEQWARGLAGGFGASSFQLFLAVTLPDDYHPAFVKWLNDQGLGSLAFSGAGEVLWLESGRIFAKLLCRVTSAALSRQTFQLWPAVEAHCRFVESGMTDEQLGRELEEAKHEMRKDRRVVRGD